MRSLAVSDAAVLCLDANSRLLATRDGVHSLAAAVRTQMLATQASAVRLIVALHSLPADAAAAAALFASVSRSLRARFARLLPEIAKPDNKVHKARCDPTTNELTEPNRTERDVATSQSLIIMPVSAVTGENVVPLVEPATRNVAYPFYVGRSLYEELLDVPLVEPTDQKSDAPLRVLTTARYRHQGFSLFTGRVISGVLTTGDKILCAFSVVVRVSSSRRLSARWRDSPQGRLRRNVSRRRDTGDSQAGAVGARRRHAGCDDEGRDASRRC